MGLHEDRLVLTQARYSALYHRIQHRACCLVVAFCVLSMVSFSFFLPPMSPSSGRTVAFSRYFSRWPHSRASIRLCPPVVFYFVTGLACLSSLSGLFVAAFQAIGAFSNASPAFPQSSIDEEINAQRRCLAAELPRMAYCVMFLILAAFFVTGAYVFGVLASPVDDWPMQMLMIGPSAISGVMFLHALLTFRETFRVWISISMFDVQLWNAIKKETMFGYLAAKYCSLLARNEQVSTDV